MDEKIAVFDSVGEDFGPLCLENIEKITAGKAPDYLIVQHMEPDHSKNITIAVEDAFRYGKIVLATTTYNGDIFPFMKEFIFHLTERNFSNKFVGIIENGSWAPLADKIIKGMLEKSKNLTFANQGVRILSSVSEQNVQEIKELAKELI